MSDIAGFIEMDSKVLHQACKTYLRERQRRVDSECEALIESEMGKRFFAPKTRDDAIEKLQTRKPSSLMSPFQEVHTSRVYWANQIEDLLIASSMSPRVLVNANIASLLKPYIEN